VSAFLDELRATLPRHAAVLDALVAAVEGDERWRWLELGCSVASGRGDEWSDLDLGLGARPDDEGALPVGAAEAAEALVRSPGPVTDLLVHDLPHRPAHHRIAAELDTGVQVDLVVLPASDRPGLPPGSVALVDKDGALAGEWRPGAIGTPEAAVLREWSFLGWWALSDAAKYLARASVFEAADRVAEARRLALQLHAVAHGVDYPVFGLTSILDEPDPVTPMWLEETYAVAEVDPMRQAVGATARLLRDATTAVELRLGIDVDVPLRAVVQARLAGM
jgi:hypothetical protein